MKNLVYDLPEDIQDQIMRLNPHPLNEIIEDVTDWHQRYLKRCQINSMKYDVIIAPFYKKILEWNRSNTKERKYISLYEN